MNDPVSELRDAFDRSFALPPPQEVPALTDLLTLTVGGERYAIRLGELKGIAEAGSIVRVPSRRPELLGLAGVRGVPLPVFRLSALLGRPEPEPVRWILLCGVGDLLGLAVSSFDEYLRVPPGDIRDHRVRSAAGVRSVIHLPSLIRSIQD